MREMLRIKRSVQAMYNTQVNMMSAQMLNNASNQISDVTLDAMRLLDSKITSNAGNRDFMHIHTHPFSSLHFINFKQF